MRNLYQDNFDRRSSRKLDDLHIVTGILKGQRTSEFDGVGDALAGMAGREDEAIFSSIAHDVAVHQVFYPSTILAHHGNECLY